MAGAFLAHQGCGGGEEETSSGGCSGSQTSCNGTCVDTSLDPNNCGICGNVCSADQQCIAGQCECAAGHISCAGVCVDPNTNPAHCGGCNNPCSEGEDCVAASCGCPNGQAPCTGGCTDLNTDELNCGQCNRSCGAAEECVNGDCTCPDGTTSCYSQCVDTTSDSNFCGDCDTACNTGEYCEASNCETINSCGDVSEDQYEGNDTCQAVRVLPVANENASTATIGDPTLHHTDQSLDTDWYKIPTAEAFHLDCVTNPLSSQCYFVFEIAFAPPDVAAHDTYQMCLRANSCTGTAHCTDSSDWNGTTNKYEMALQWEGTCGLDDEPEIYVEIKRNGGTESCEQYSLEYRYVFTDGTCS
jgi:hypothetical protein